MRKASQEAATAREAAATREAAKGVDVFEDLGFSGAEAIELRVKSEIYRELMRHLRERGLSQAKLAALLGIHQPDVSQLLRGRVSRFSIERLIQFAGRLDLDPRIRLTARKTAVPATPRRKARADSRKKLQAAA